MSYVAHDDGAAAHRSRQRPPALALADAPPSHQHQLLNIPNNYDTKTIDEQAYPLIPEASARVSPLLCRISAHIALQEDYYAVPNTAPVDPYYFPSRQLNQHTKTPELKSSSFRPSPTSSAAGISDPTTPGRDPAAIDRRALVGVGELATPRWTTRHEYISRKEWEGKGTGVEEVQEELCAEPEPIEDMENDVDSSSPWTIEAVDDNDTGEQKDYVSLLSMWTFRAVVIDGESRSCLVRRLHFQCANLIHPPHTSTLHAPCALASRSRRVGVKRSSIHAPSSKLDLHLTAAPGFLTRADNLRALL